MKTNQSSLCRSVRGLRRVVLVGAVAGAAVLGVASVAAAADGTSVTADVQCNASGDGVVDVTLINDGQDAAVFQVGGASYEVAGLSAHALTYEGVADGSFSVAVSANGADESVSVNVACDAPKVEVLSAGGASSDASLPSTGTGVGWGLVIGGVLVIAGVAVSLLARRRHYG